MAPPNRISAPVNPTKPPFVRDVDWQMREYMRWTVTMDFEDLRRAVEAEIDGYRQPTALGMVGNPLPADRIEVEVAAMRAALVTPYWAEVDTRDIFQQVASDAGPIVRCAVVADDASGSVLAFDPMEHEFLIAVRQNGRLRSVGVRGDAVGCFIAR
jgi:hypothetical protein